MSNRKAQARKNSPDYERSYSKTLAFSENSVSMLSVIESQDDTLGMLSTYSFSLFRSIVTTSSVKTDPTQMQSHHGNWSALINKEKLL